MPGGLGPGGQEPGGAVEQIRAGVLDPGVLGPGQRMAADEARVGVGGRDRALGRADVGDHAVGPAAASDLGDQPGQRADRRGDEHRLGPVDRVGELGRGPVDRAALPAAAAARRTTGPIPPTSAPRRSRAARATEPPISPTPMTASRIRRVRRYAGASRRARTAAASPSSTSTVVSQPMQPSVIDWP